MAFGSESFPLGPAGGFPKNRIASAGNEIAPPEMMEEMYDSQNHAKLPVRERDYHSSVSRVKDKMKMGRPHKNADAPDEWLKRRKQRFPYGLEKEGERVRPGSAIGQPAAGMSGVGFFGMKGELGDVEQKYGEDAAMWDRKVYRRKF